MPNTERKSDWAERMEEDILEIKKTMAALLERTNQVGEQGRAIERAFGTVEKLDIRLTTRIDGMDARVATLERLAPETKLVTAGVIKLVGAVLLALIAAILVLVIRQPAALSYLPQVPYVAPVEAPHP